MKKTALLLTLLIIIPIIAACGDGSGTGSQQTTAPNDTNIDGIEETTVPLTDGLPDTDMDGFVLRILHTTP